MPTLTTLSERYYCNLEYRTLHSPYVAKATLLRGCVRSIDSTIACWHGQVAKDILKTNAGRIGAMLRRIVANVRRDIRREQLEQRLALGPGRLPNDSPVFTAEVALPSRQLYRAAGGGAEVAADTVLSGRDVP